MELEQTTSEVTVAVVHAIANAPEPFGTRPSRGRPHSISLCAAAPAPSRSGAARGVDVLLGVGIGAVAMYYLDPEGGAPRRAAVRDTIVQAVTMAPDLFEDAVWRALPHASGGDALRPARTSRGAWTPATRLAASAAGAVLALLAGRRHDALGAVVGLAGAALLARGATREQPRSAVSSHQSLELDPVLDMQPHAGWSQVTPEPVAR